VTVILNTNEYSPVTVTTSTFTEQDPTTLTYDPITLTANSFMPVTFDTTEYSAQTATGLTYTGLTATTSTYSNQTATSVAYDVFSKIDGSLYGGGIYSSEDEVYGGRPFLLGRKDD